METTNLISSEAASLVLIHTAHELVTASTSSGTQAAAGGAATRGEGKIVETENVYHRRRASGAASPVVGSIAARALRSHRVKRSDAKTEN